MYRNGRPRLFWSLILLLALVSTLCLYQLATTTLHSALQQGVLSANVNQAAISGGRAKGGTFNRPSSPAPSYSPTPSYSRSAPRGYSEGYSDYDERPSRPYPRSYYPSYPAPAPILIPFPAAPGPTYVPSPTYAEPVDDGLDIGFIFVLLVLGFAVLPIVLNYIRLSSTKSEQTGADQLNELANDVVTVTRLQVALLAQARELQRDLTTLAEQADLSTKQGLSELLRETILALLRNPEYWTHARSSSQTLKTREAGSRLFERLSLEERSKFSMETLVNVGGQVRRQTMPTSDADPAAYIVVTLLVGTADDYPLIGTVRSTSELKQALQRLGAISPDYLLVYELLWTPQDERDSLSREELIAQYPDLVQL
ncbi:MAG: DUF1517 domain-containing protein [Elainella sp. C42_A2020_010]|nr:DUF1517 domain-containing protein [Elainella sp. C42_A2020_010]